MRTMYFRLHRFFLPPVRVVTGLMLYQLLEAVIPTTRAGKEGSKNSCLRRQHEKRWREIKTPGASSSREAGHFISNNDLLVIATS